MKMTSAAFLVLLTATASAEVFVVQAYPTSFVPATVNVVPGDTVQWVYASGYPHTVTSGSGCSGDGLFHGVLQIPGDTFEWEVPEGGDDVVSYFCQPHCAAGMTGEIVVGTAPEAGQIGITVVGSNNVALTYEAGGVGMTTLQFATEPDTTGSFSLGLETEGSDAILTVLTATTTGSALLQIRNATLGTLTPLTPGEVTLELGHAYLLFGSNHAGPAGDFDLLISMSEPGADDLIKRLTLTGTASLDTVGGGLTIRAMTTGHAQLTLAASTESSIEGLFIGDVSSTLVLPPEGVEGTIELPVGESVIKLNESHAGQSIFILNSDDEPDTLPCPADVNRNGVVDVDDLLMVIVEWGVCP